MARPLRIEYEGAWYHVMNRGLARKPIFLNDKNRSDFIDLLKEINHRYKIEVHAYCLMDNHYHLLLRTPVGNLSRAMRHLNGVYTQKFNLMRNQDGPIFRGRYKSIIVDADAYLLKLSCYIHLNPVIAGMVKNAQDYPWSSYNAYISSCKKSPPPIWLSQDQTLDYFGERASRKKYQLFVEEGVDKEIDDYFKKLKRLPFLGSEKFIKTLSLKHLKESHKITDIPMHKKLKIIPDMNEILKQVSGYYEISVREIKTIKKRSGNLPRSVAMYIAAHIGQYKLKQIAEALNGVSISAVSKNNRIIAKAILKDKLLAKDIEYLSMTMSGKVI